VSSVTATAFALVGEEGIFLDPVVMRKNGTKHYASLGAFLDPPASGVIEAKLAYQYNDLHLDELAGSSIVQAARSASDHPYRKEISVPVEVTKYVNRPEPFVLRVVARVTSGTGHIVLPTISVESK